MATTEKAAPAAKTDNGGDGDLHVLVDAFVARTSEKNTVTRRYRRGERFNPVENVHDVDALIRAKVIGRKDPDGRAQRTTALMASQAQAEINQEDSPVIDLRSQPFEQPKADETLDAEA